VLITVALTGVAQPAPGLGYFTALKWSTGAIAIWILLRAAARRTAFFR
jgi:hypothetical protein